MKKIIVVILALLLLGSGANAGMSLGAFLASYMYSGDTSFGYGVEIPIPVMPLVSTRLIGAYVPVANSEDALIPVTLGAKLNVPLTPVYFDAAAGYLFYSIQNTAAAPTGAITYSLAVGYENNFMPLTSVFIQGGYEAIRLDYGLGVYDLSGFGAKAGIRIGI